MDINQEINDMAETMEKSNEKNAFSVDLIKSTVIKLGAEGLKKAAARLSPEQKVLLTEVLEDMKKSHTQLIAKDKAVTLEPTSNSTPSGDYKFNEDERPQFDEQDEKLATEAKKKDQEDIKHQGGGAPVEGWEGQVIKSSKQGEVMAFYGDKAKAEERKEAKKEDKEVKKLPDMQKAEGEGEGAPELEKGGSGSGRKEVNPALAGVESVQALAERAKEGAKVDAKFDEQEKKPSVDDRKKMAKANLKGIMKKMQDGKMEKSECCSKLAKSLEVDEGKLGNLWDALAKSDVLSEKGNPEGSQSAVPSIMKDEGKVAKRIPDSGKAKQTADGGEQPPAPLAKAKKKDEYFHTEEDVYEAAVTTNPFAVRTVAKSMNYKVDEFIDLEAASQAQRLKKSTFDYGNEEEVLAKGMEGGDPAAQVVEQNAKKQSEAKKEDADEVRQIKIDEKLSRIEGHGQKMPMLKGKMKKSIVDDLIEKSLDMDQTRFDQAAANRTAEASGAFFVKSFNDADMDDLFKEPDMYKAEDKK